MVIGGRAAPQPEEHARYELRDTVLRTREHRHTRKRATHARHIQHNPAGDMRTAQEGEREEEGERAGEAENGSMKHTPP